jgi:hypothetical protein
MRGFHFGAVSEDADGSYGRYALHLQCPWRLEGPGGLVTGQGDLWEHPTLEVPPDDWTWDGGESRQDMRLGAVLGGRDGRTGSWLNSAADRLVVTGVDASDLGDLSLALAGGYTLRVFPDGTGGEAWRLLSPGSEAPHFVVSPPDGAPSVPTEA